MSVHSQTQAFRLSHCRIPKTANSRIAIKSLHRERAGIEIDLHDCCSIVSLHWVYDVASNRDVICSDVMPSTKCFNEVLSVAMRARECRE